MKATLIFFGAMVSLFLGLACGVKLPPLPPLPSTPQQAEVVRPRPAASPSPQ